MQLAKTAILLTTAAFVVTAVGLTASPPDAATAAQPATTQGQRTSSMKPLRIISEPLCPGTISQMQCGQFIEYLCEFVPGMWAEKLYDNGFEGPRLLGPKYVKKTDLFVWPWYPSGETDHAVYTLDKTTYVSPAVSQKITAAGDAPSTVGIAQDGVAVDQGVPCDFSCFFKQNDVTSPVTVRIQGKDRLLASCEFKPDAEWRKFRAKLVFPASAPDATLTISFRGPGTLWIDNASLMPQNAIGGWRPDVVAAVKAMKPGIIRFGGNALFSMRWRDTIGDPDRRTAFTAWGGLQTLGAGLEEIVQFIQAVDAEPLVCVNFNKDPKTLEDAAAQVEYFNGAATQPMGELRAKNGHPKPYKIKYWQVGNEVGSPEYAELLPRYCEAMKRADPSISILSSYPSDTVLKAAAAYLDYICPHHYAPGFSVSGEAAHCRRLIKDYAGGRDIKVGITEWNATAGDTLPVRAVKLGSLANGLYCARVHNSMHRNCDVVQIANRSNLMNSGYAGFLQTSRSGLYKMPAYYVQQLYASYASGGRPLKMEGVRDGLDVSAILSARKDKVFLFVVNPAAQDMTEVLDISAFGKTGQGLRRWVVADRENAGDQTVMNSFADPARVASHPGTFRVDSPLFEYVFPALSLTVLEWAVQP